MKKFMAMLVVAMMPLILGMNLFHDGRMSISTNSMLITPTATPETLSLEEYWNMIVDWHKLDVTYFVPRWNDYRVGETEFQTIAQDIQDIYNLSSNELVVYDEKLDITAPNNYIYPGYANISIAVFSDDSQPLPKLEIYGLYFPVNRSTPSGEYYVPCDIQETLTPASVLSAEDYQPSAIYSAKSDTTPEFIVIFAYDLGVAYQYYGNVLPNDSSREAICNDIEIIGVTTWVYDDESGETIIELLNRKLEENNLSQLYLGMRGIDFEFSEIGTTDKIVSQIESIQGSNCLLDLISISD
ncbi:MAG: hypothetical protein L0154_04200 [Chloroflexi bacterium]|nr:hypothetical protein [Chloroflexota bacterium]